MRRRRSCKAKRRKKLTLQAEAREVPEGGEGQAHVRQAARGGEALPTQVPAEDAGRRRSRWRSGRSRSRRRPRPGPSAPPTINSPIAKYTGAFGLRQAERLLWRAGFGPRPGHAQALVEPRARARGALAHPPRRGARRSPAPRPTDDGRRRSQPDDAWGHDHLWFLDRMVRTNQPLIERMTLIWHDWFATSTTGAEQRYMLDQNELFRRHALGSFRQLALDITADPAMIQWLNQTDNTRCNPNENYARELMELFTLGADRGAYTEDDVRELARCLTGWRSDWSRGAGRAQLPLRPQPPRPRPEDGVRPAPAPGAGRTRCRLCLENPKHASFVVEKLWSYFIPVAAVGLGARGARARLRAGRLRDPAAGRGDPDAPAAHRRPADGQAAGGLPRRDAAPAAPADRHDGLDLAGRRDGPAPVPPAQRGRAGTTTAGSTPAPGAARWETVRATSYADRAQRRRLRRLRPRPRRRRPALNSGPRLLGQPATDVRRPRGAARASRPPACRHPRELAAEPPTAPSARTPCAN